jgi:hypothetical protein
MFNDIAEVAKEMSVDLQNGNFISDMCPSFLKPSHEIADYEIEAAAHSACHFFGLPDAEVREGNTIGVYVENIDTTIDDHFEYNKKQFEDMGWTSFEDQTKVWTHECGHRILQKMFGPGWTNELGSDYMVGIREEILGLGESQFEKSLGKTVASVSHPGGPLRLRAIKFGREVAAEMKSKGITPTWENCVERFRQSEFANYNYENTQGGNFMGLFVDSKQFHENEAKRCAEEADYYANQAKKAADKGDFAKAKEMTSKSQDFAREAKEHQNSKAQCTK